MYHFKYTFEDIENMTSEQLTFLLQGYILMKEQEAELYKKVQNQ